MRFGVLGPLAVWTDTGTPVTVPGAKVRALLADLLVHRGALVTADRLVEDLWGADQPGNPAGALQAKVSQLRRALEEAEPGARALVVSRGPGYLLQVDQDAVDAGRFATLIAAARGAGHQRAGLFAEALALWRGPAFADVADQEFATAAIGQLQEQRLSAVEQHAEARLALGEHDLLIGELDTLLAEHPLRERLRATQLRALWQAGRQAEALRSYDELRERLRDELGLDPSPELVALRQSILEQDTDLGAMAVPLPRRTNLPAPVASLIGRADAVTQVRALLDTGRLVTLTGPGGVGKTQLALETARQQAGAAPDGVWLVELAALDCSGDPDPVGALAALVTAALGIRDDTATEPLDRLAEVVRDKHLLLVLDNCEHVIESAAELAEHLLRSASQLRVLATSREPLGVGGELLWPVPPLPEPSAVELFVARTAAAVPGFGLDRHNADTVAAICRRLDGLPLALELAAARVRTLGLAELDVRLDDRFRLLTAGPRAAPARQRTLRAVIDWSWEPLSAPERAVLRRLAVHADGCALEAAEVVCAGDGVTAVDVLDLLARLVDRSLVTVVDSAGGARYRLLESVAAYCVEKLDEAGETERVRLSHAQFCVELAERAAPYLRGREQQKWLLRLDIESANIRSALDFLVHQGNVAFALRLVNAMGWYWFLRGRHLEARRAYTAALDVDAPAPPLARADAAAWQSGLAIMNGSVADPAEHSRVVLKAYADAPAELARAQWLHGFAMGGIGQLSTCEQLIGTALAEFRRLGDRWGIAAALSIRGMHGLMRGGLEQARRDGEEGAALFDELGDRWGQLRAGDLLSAVDEVGGDYDRAAQRHRDGLRRAEELGLWLAVVDQLSRLGRLAALTGDHDAADEFHGRALRLAREQSFESGAVYAELGLGMVARRTGRLDLAATHLGAVHEWHLDTDYLPGMAFTLAELGFVAEQRGDADTASALHRQGLDHAREIGDPRAIALGLEGLAGARALAGQHRHAAALLGAAAAARESAGAPLPAAERFDVDRIGTAARQALGAKGFAAAFTAGGQLDLDGVLVPGDQES